MSLFKKVVLFNQLDSYTASGNEVEEGEPENISDLK